MASTDDISLLDPSALCFRPRSTQVSSEDAENDDILLTLRAPNPEINIDGTSDSIKASSNIEDFVTAEPTTTQKILSMSANEDHDVEFLPPVTMGLVDIPWISPSNHNGTLLEGLGNMTAPKVTPESGSSDTLVSFYHLLHHSPTSSDENRFSPYQDSSSQPLTSSPCIRLPPSHLSTPSLPAPTIVGTPHHPPSSLASITPPSRHLSPTPGMQKQTSLSPQSLGNDFATLASRKPQRLGFEPRKKRVPLPIRLSWAPRLRLVSPQSPKLEPTSPPVVPSPLRLSPSPRRANSPVMSEEYAVLVEVARLFAAMDAEERARFAEKLGQVVGEFNGKEDLEGDGKFKEGYRKGHRVGLEEGKAWVLERTQEAGKLEGGCEAEEEGKAFL